MERNKLIVIMLTLAVSDHFPVSRYAIAIASQHDQQPFAFHRHEFAELVVVSSGRALHLTEQGSYPVGAGDVFFIPPTRPHGYEDTKGLDLENILFLPERVHLPDDDLRKMPGYRVLFELEPDYRDTHRFAGRLKLPPTEMEKVMPLIWQMKAEGREESVGGDVLMQALFAQLVVLLARSYEGYAPPIGRQLLSLEKALSHINQHYAESLSLADLAALSSMSVSTFKRAFKEVTGDSPVNFLINLRLQRACQLLRETSLSITEVAYRTGFGDSNYFTRQFRQRLGDTPAEWRGREE